jgi:predicted CopG family antitoxin
MGSDTVTISIKRPLQRDLWELKDAPEETYSEVIGELYEHYQEAAGERGSE